MTVSDAVELVLFDLDGTLIDYDGAVATAVETWLLERLGSGLASLALIVTWDEIAEHHFPAYRARQVTFQGRRRMRLRDFLPYVGFDPSTWSGTQLDEAFAGYLRAYEAAWRPFPDVEPCLRALQPLVTVGVLSNSDQAQQQDKVIRTGLDRYLDVVLTSGLLGVAKPDAGVFEAACRRWGVAPQKVMYVGDRLEVDAVAAGAAGLRGIWLDRRCGGFLTAVETITTLVQLPALVSRPGGLGGAADA